MESVEDCLENTAIVAKIMRLLGPILCCTMLALITFVVYTWWLVLLPYALGDEPWGIYAVLHVVFAGIILFNVLFNYTCIVLVNPGNPEPSDESTFYGDGVKICKKCQRVKPQRTHHCVICQTCVLKQDHHCPWVMNCVGFYNHKFFILFLFYLCIGCIYISIMSAFPFFAKIRQKPLDVKLFLAFIFSTGFALVLIGFVGWQFYLLLTGQTQIEFYANSMKKRRYKKKGKVFVNPYDLGFKKNFSLFFGVRHWWMFAWPSLQMAPGDGINFPTVSMQ